MSWSTNSHDFVAAAFLKTKQNETAELQLVAYLARIAILTSTIVYFGWLTFRNASTHQHYLKSVEYELVG